MTNAWDLTAAVLLHPEGRFDLRVRRLTGDEAPVALSVTTATNRLRGPTLSVADRTALQDLLRRWLSEPPNPTPDAAAESRRFEQATALSRLPAVRAAAFKQLGVAYELADALGPAIRAYGRACHLEPATSLYRFNLALALRQIGSFERAHELLQEVVRLQPDSVPVRQRLAEVTSLLGRHEEALARATSLLQEAPEDPVTLRLQAQILLKLRRPADAAAPARRAVELTPHSSGLHNNLGEVLRRRGRIDEAEPHFRRALELAPQNPRVANALASFLADHRLELEEALALATRAVRSAPHDAEFLDTLGWVHAQRGDLENAERTLQRALDRAGSEPPAQEIRKHLEQLRERKPPARN